ncbi:MAG: class I SAM-dependent methyltransferase [Bacteroidota bacterium]
MASNYDNAAWFYDRLSRIIYGKALITAQTAFLYLIPANSNILIAGGGTGWLIEAISKLHPSGLNITYVELSEKMMALSKKRNTGANTVIYINAPIEEASLQAGFDVIITPFLLDSLSPATFDKVFNTLDSLLKTTGIWLNTDFQLTGKWWQPILLKCMYIFFRMIGCVENVELPLIKQRFNRNGYQPQKEQTFFGEFIAATIYKK